MSNASTNVTAVLNDGHLSIKDYEEHPEGDENWHSQSQYFHLFLLQLLN